VTNKEIKKITRYQYDYISGMEQLKLSKKEFFKYILDHVSKTYTGKIIYSFEKSSRDFCLLIEKNIESENLAHELNVKLSNIYYLKEKEYHKDFKLGQNRRFDIHLYLSSEELFVKVLCLEYQMIWLNEILYKISENLKEYSSYGFLDLIQMMNSFNENYLLEKRKKYLKEEAGRDLIFLQRQKELAFTAFEKYVEETTDLIFMGLGDNSNGK